MQMSANETSTTPAAKDDTLFHLFLVLFKYCSFLVEICGILIKPYTVTEISYMLHPACRFKKLNMFQLSLAKLPFGYDGMALNQSNNPENEGIRPPPEKGPFQSIFQPSIFRGYVSFSGGNNI